MNATEHSGKLRRLAVLLTAGAIATGLSTAAAGARTDRPVASRRPGWVIEPAARPAPSTAASRLAEDLGVGPEKAQEIIDAAYR
jgi:hypothetical protein